MRMLSQAQQKINHSSNKIRKGEKGKSKNKIKQKKSKTKLMSISSPKSQHFNFCACPSRRKNIIKVNASGRKGILSCCKSPLE